MTEIICAYCNKVYQTDSALAIQLPWFCSVDCEEKAKKAGLVVEKERVPRVRRPDPLLSQNEPLEEQSDKIPIDLEEEVLVNDEAEEKPIINYKEYFVLMLTEKQHDLLLSLMSYYYFLKPDHKIISNLLQKINKAEKVKIKK